jgi:hypothetical protein
MPDWGANRVPRPLASPWRQHTGGRVNTLIRVMGADEENAAAGLYRRMCCYCSNVENSAYIAGFETLMVGPTAIQ